MNRRSAAALLLAATLLSGSAVIAADAGSSSDPLITLSWLKDTFIPDTVAKAEKRIEDQMEKMDSSALSGQGISGSELRVKRGDVLRLETGNGLISLAGSLSGTSNGSIIDLTTGTELTPGSALVLNHQYLAAENTSAVFSVISDTAVVRFTGNYQLSSSGEVDYNALADALKALGLFKGSTVPYGSGYELEAAPTRIQSLILFLRLMGEETAALDYSGGVVFSDVPSWAQPYAAYAYDKGYAKGRGKDAQGHVIFDSNTSVSADEYATFLLRALSYEEGIDFNWLTAVHDGVSLNVFTSGEEIMLKNKTFLRAQTVYLSYYALSAQVKGTGETLLDQLIGREAVDGAAASQVIASAAGKRL